MQHLINKKKKSLEHCFGFVADPSKVRPTFISKPEKDMWKKFGVQYVQEISGQIINDIGDISLKDIPNEQKCSVPSSWI